MGVIPGLKEPSCAEINHFLKPLVNSFEVTFTSGVQYSRAHKYPHSRTVQSAIVCVVGDLPAIQKITGSALYGKAFCAMCKLNKGSINELDRSKWIPCTHSEQLEVAIKWRDAPSISEQKKTFDSQGLRRSELFNTISLDFMESIVIDGMHNLFLGLVQHHCWFILGINTPIPASQEHNLCICDIDVLESTINSINFDNTQKTLDIPILHVICANKGISVHGTARQVTRAEILDALKVSI